MIDIYNEPLRPKVHFSPQTGWMNDPNGLVFFDGEYHLFYQFNPKEIDQPAPRHWGHAVSTNLVHWKHLPIALYPDSLGEIWSGSVVVDWENTSKLSTNEKPTMVAVFTHYDGGLQQQSIAYSNDRGRKWKKYSENPVIPNPGLKDFRDPKVFWHQTTNCWIMVLAVGDQVMFYTSPNLIYWKYASTFGALDGSHSGMWECPDLFPLKTDHQNDIERWVLLVSVGSGAPNGGSGIQYFVGEFDGRNFTNHNPSSVVNWVDYGKDDYAAVTFSGVEDRKVLLGWMNNWCYAYQIPTQPWKGMMTIPKELGLVIDEDETPILVSKPIHELEILREKNFRITNQLLTSGVNENLLGDLDGSPIEIDLDIMLQNAIQIGLLFHFSDQSLLHLGYDSSTSKLFLDRRESGLVHLESSFARHIHSAPLTLDHSQLRLKIILDTSSIEVFADEGRLVMTDIFFPCGRLDYIKISTGDDDIIINSLDVWCLSTIWENAD